MFSEKELEKQNSKIKRTLFVVFVPILIFISVIFVYRNNSFSYIKEEYFSSRNKEFNGIVVSKYQDGDNFRATRYLILDINHQEFVDKELYQKISIGDSIIKRKGSDSILFKLKNGKKIVKDYNSRLRKKYQELLKNKN
ncbi:hypothetical protein [Polaribacter sp. SA4-12]|uniref:hypothetical protein n=1 Tax=Polaribacter sp. SA4-12 TaxID=1312072 RepID=UPI000B3C37E7|nr:hypothetical protein [Polaribacter sp. SA4-12]ARV16282.1 hypothetical protein BTO07_14510 [Polaribacter sp. SA4-12]